MKSFSASECVCEKQFSNDNAPPRPSLHRPRLCRGSRSFFGILRHPIYPCLYIVACIRRIYGFNVLKMEDGAGGDKGGPNYPPKNAPNTPYRPQTTDMGKDEGKEWEYVTVASSQTRRMGTVTAATA